MSPFFKKSTPINTLSVFMVLLGLFFWFGFPSPAAEGQTEPVPNGATETTTETKEDAEPADAQENLLCILEIADDVAVYDADMIEFLEQHYLADETATELLEVALIKFDEYRINMRNLLTEYRVAQQGQTADQEFQEGDACRQFVEEHIAVIDAMFRNHHVRNSGGKVSYQLVNKLKAINDQLRELNDQFAQMYGAFKTFSDKLPGTVP